MQLPSVNGFPPFEPPVSVDVNQGSHLCIQNSNQSVQVLDSSRKMQQALEALFSKPESVELVPTQTSGFSVIDKHLPIERSSGEQQLGSAGFEGSADWCLGGKALRLVTGAENTKPGVGGFVPQEGESGHEEMAGFEGLGVLGGKKRPYWEALLGKTFCRSPGS
jgi:hypothetical protein